MVAVPLPAEATPIVGASGIVEGVTALLITDEVPVPFELVAVIVKV